MHAYFLHKTRRKARYFRFELHHSSLDNCMLIRLLSHIKSLIDCLRSVREPVALKEYLDLILEGLPQEYDIVITLVNSESDVITIEEVEGFIIA